MPSAPPVNISARSLSSTSILVQWYEVPDSDKNGIILSYTVNYKASEGNLQQSQVVNASTREVTLIGLDKNTAYKIEMFANTSKGGGRKSEPITLKTDEDSKYIIPQVTAAALVMEKAADALCRFGILPKFTLLSREKNLIYITTVLCIILSLILLRMCGIICLCLLNQLPRSSIGY